MNDARRPVRRVLAVRACEEPDEVDARIPHPFTSSLVLFPPGARPSTVIGRRSLRSRSCVATHRVYPSIPIHAFVDAQPATYGGSRQGAAHVHNAQVATPLS